MCTYWAVMKRREPFKNNFHAIAKVTAMGGWWGIDPNDFPLAGLEFLGALIKLRRSCISNACDALGYDSDGQNQFMLLLHEITHDFVMIAASHDVVSTVLSASELWRATEFDRCPTRLRREACPFVHVRPMLLAPFCHAS